MNGWWAATLCFLLVAAIGCSSNDEATPEETDAQSLVLSALQQLENAQSYEINGESDSTADWETKIADSDWAIEQAADDTAPECAQPDRPISAGCGWEIESNQSGALLRQCDTEGCTTYPGMPDGLAAFALADLDSFTLPSWPIALLQSVQSAEIVEMNENEITVRVAFDAAEVGSSADVITLGVSTAGGECSVTGNIDVFSSDTSTPVSTCILYDHSEFTSEALLKFVTENGELSEIKATIADLQGETSEISLRIQTSAG